MNKKSFLTASTLALAISTATTAVYSAELEEIIVTAQKRAESLQDVPVSVSALREETLEERGINVFEDKRNQQILRPALDSGDVERLKKAMGLFVYGPNGRDPILRMRRMRELNMMNDPNFLMIDEN